MSTNGDTRREVTSITLGVFSGSENPTLEAAQGSLYEQIGKDGEVVAHWAYTKLGWVKLADAGKSVPMNAQSSTERGEANKSIDWTKPLRVVGTHEPARVCAIDPSMSLPVLVKWTSARHSQPVEYWTGRDGKTVSIYDFAVENIPPEPRIVERWTYVSKDYDRAAAMWGVKFWHSRRPTADEMYRDTLDKSLLARVLIEEPE